MRNLFVIKAGECEDLSVYEQVFHDAGFRFVMTDDRDDLLLCDGALLYGNQDAADSVLCGELIRFCRERSIPLLILCDQTCFEELRDEEGVYDASLISMDAWCEILKPEVREQRKYTRKERAVLNAVLAAVCILFAVLFGYRMNQVLTEETVPAQTEVTETILNAYGTAAVRVYSISSFGDTVYRGSGYAVSTDGYVLTNAHVIDHPSSMYRIVYGPQTLPAEVIAQDEEKDLALLKVNALTQPLKMAESEPEKGSLIYMIGWPENGPKAASAGIYDGTAAFDGTHLFKVISMNMHPGVSGSCIINEKGEVIGTAAAMNSEDHSIGFIIPLASCNDFLREHVFNK